MPVLPWQDGHLYDVLFAAEALQRRIGLYGKDLVQETIDIVKALDEGGRFAELMQLRCDSRRRSLGELFNFANALSRGMHAPSRPHVRGDGV